MTETALKKEAITYFETMNESNIQLVVSYMKTLDSVSLPKQKRSLADLKGKIHFAENYDYKAMRN